MLQHTFCHISGIGLKTEQLLWDSGIADWQTVLGRCGETGPVFKRGLIEPAVEASVRHLERGDAGYFATSLPSSEVWRLFSAFRDSTAYIDIETTGLDVFSEITTIALYDGAAVRYYVNGQNLDDFTEDIGAYGTIVTYNGKCFDVPFLEKFFSISMPQAHIDLRYVLKSLGYGGGLKGCERQLGIHRGDLTGIDGFFAVRLWADYIHRGNVRALETLLRYNIEDVVNLEKLMIAAYNQKLGNTPFSDRLALPEPGPVAVPFSPHLPTIERLMRCERHGHFLHPGPEKDNEESLW